MVGLIQKIKRLYRKHMYEYGSTKVIGGLSSSTWNTPSRKHKINGNVQFILWKKGEQGHSRDYWIDFHSSHWIEFKKEEKQCLL